MMQLSMDSFSTRQLAYFVTLALLLLGANGASAQSPTLAERLDYPADDLGVAHAENAASIRALATEVFRLLHR
jgi:hypothetical protein